MKNVQKGIIRVNHLEEDLFKFFVEFDEDITGMNGEEYTLSEAIINGFNDSLTYLVAKAKKIKQTPVEIVEFVLKEVEKTYASYDFVESIILDFNDEVIEVLFAYGEV